MLIYSETQRKIIYVADALALKQAQSQECKLLGSAQMLTCSCAYFPVGEKIDTLFSGDMSTAVIRAQNFGSSFGGFRPTARTNILAEHRFAT